MLVVTHLSRVQRTLDVVGPHVRWEVIYNADRGGSDTDVPGQPVYYSCNNVSLQIQKTYPVQKLCVRHDKFIYEALLEHKGRSGPTAFKKYLLNTSIRR
jgi:hypothetical protein